MARAGACIIITGPVGAGKTSALAAAVLRLDDRGAGLAAILQPDIGRHPDGRGKGYELELSTNASGAMRRGRLPLAREVGAPGTSPYGDLELGRFRFDRSAFAAAEAFLREALASAPAPELLLIDEVGRLELDRREGLWPCLERALEAAAEPGGPRLIVSVRQDRSERLLDLAAALSLPTSLLVLPRDSVSLASAIS